MATQYGDRPMYIGGEFVASGQRRVDGFGESRHW